MYFVGCNLQYLLYATCSRVKIAVQCTRYVLVMRIPSTLQFYPIYLWLIAVVYVILEVLFPICIGSSIIKKKLLYDSHEYCFNYLFLSWEMRMLNKICPHAEKNPPFGWGDDRVSTCFAKLWISSLGA